eukprot:s77_g12.t1
MAEPEKTDQFPPHHLIEQFVKPVRGQADSKSPARKTESRGRRRITKNDAPRQKRSSVSMMSSLTIEALQFLLQQPRNRLLIEESHELQAGTQMGKYMEQKGQETNVFQRDASRPAAGFLRPFSFARRVAQEVFMAWAEHIAQMKDEGIPRRRKRSSSVLLVRDMDMSVANARLSDSSSSEDEDFGESIFDPLVLDPEDLHSVFRVGSLMASANKAKQEGQISPRSGRRTEAAPTERNSFEETMPELLETPQEQPEERKAVRRRPQKSISKDLSKGPRWGEDFSSLDEQMRRERLMNDSTYVGFQLVKLKRSQVMQRHFAEVGDIFEAGKGFRSPKPKRLNKDMESLSLPSLQPRASASGSAFEGSKRGSAVEKSREDKKEKKKGLDASSTMTQVRDLKALLKAELPASMPATKGSKSDLTKCCGSYYWTLAPPFLLDSCQSDWAILDPYGLPSSSAPALVFPVDFNDWSQQHPAESKEQKLIEQGKQPWVGAPVNSCMNLAMRTFTGEADESVIKAPNNLVPALTLQALSDGLGWPQIDLLKLDCEGRAAWRGMDALLRVAFGTTTAAVKSADVSSSFGETNLALSRTSTSDVAAVNYLKYKTRSKQHRVT